MRKTLGRCDSGVNVRASLKGRSVRSTVGVSTPTTVAIGCPLPVIDSRPPPTTAAPTGSGDPPGPWYDTHRRLPRRGQVVLILTTRGVVHKAEFAVAYTDSWPQGVSWRVGRGDRSLPLGDVERWSPDLHAEPPRQAPAAPDAPAAAPVAPVPGGPPAIATELREEVAETGQVLARVPSPYLDWSPHPNVPSLRTLGCRLVRVVARIGWILDLSEIELAFEPDLPMLATVEEIVATYRANETVVRGLAATIDGEALRAPWRLERNGEPVAEMTRGAALRRFGLRPVVHHRAEIALMLAAVGVGTPNPSHPWPFREVALTPGPWSPA